MKNKKIVISVILVFLVFSLIDIVYLTSFKLNAFDEGLHKKAFKKYGVYEDLGKDIDKINSDLVLYLKSQKDDFDKEFFEEKELNHLRDVRLLIQEVDIYYYSIIIISIFLIIALFLLEKKNCLKRLSFVLFLSGLLSLFTVVILLIMMKLNFSGVFTLFHNIFFPQGGWLFSSSDNVVRLYPSGFFYDIGKQIFIMIIIYANILILGAVFAYFYRK